MPFPLHNGNITASSRLNPSAPPYTHTYPFQPFLQNLSSFSAGGKTHDALAAFLASTTAATANKATSLNRPCKEMLSEESNDIKNDRLRERTEISDPIDLSSSTTICGGSTGSGSNLDTSRSDINEDEDDENVDILSIDPPASPSDIEQWSVNTVVEFVSNVESCQDYQEVSLKM